jgi:hypothetical protein
MSSIISFIMSPVGDGVHNNRDDVRSFRQLLIAAGMEVRKPPALAA